MFCHKEFVNSFTQYQNMKDLKVSYFPTIVILLFAAFIAPDMAAQWTLKKDKNGVKIYTRVVEGSSLKEFKGMVDIRTTAEAAKGLILDLDSYPEWNHNCLESRLLHKNSENDFYGVTLTGAPWPVQDREAIVRTEVMEKDGSIILKMTAAPNYIPQKDGVVRIPKMDGFWKISPRSNGMVEVIQQVHASPGGRIPDWLANSAVVDTPYNTLLNMKRRLER